jgi:hypothetical protein
LSTAVEPDEILTRILKEEEGFDASEPTPDVWWLFEFWRAGAVDWKSGQRRRALSKSDWIR